MPEPGAYEWRRFTECNMCGAGVAGARSLGRRLNQRQGLRPFVVGALGEIIIAALTFGLVLGANRIWGL